MRELRKEERIPHNACLQYSIYGDLSGKMYNCVTVDISNRGLGIISSYPVEFGQFLEFDDNGSNVPALNAVVQWSAPVGVNYRAGLFLF